VAEQMAVPSGRADPIAQIITMKNPTHTTTTAAMIELAEAVDNAISSTGEFNHYTADFSLKEIKAMARAILAKNRRAKRAD
jgi:hypothetical protein